ncbi:MAG: drug/metabolite exporter YedA [Brachymonas sp.]|nr:drug/metabolite exporter YedA [Brachymonas sp.]
MKTLSLPSFSLSARGAHSAPLLIPALLACYFVWGSTYLAIRFALQGIPPFFQMASRFLVAGALLLGWVLWRQGPKALPTPRQWLHALIIGGLMLGGGMGMIAQAEVHIGSGLIATFIAVIPMMVSMWGLLFGKRPKRLEWIGMAVGMVGAILLARGGGFAAEPQGIVFIAIATLCWSLGSVLSTSKFPLADGAAGFASEMLCGGLVLLVMMYLTNEPAPVWPIPVVPAAAWLYLVVFGSLVAFSSYMYLLAHASAAVATSYAFVNPVIALLLGMAVGGERVTLWEWVATGVILTGVVLILWSKQLDSAKGASSKA